MATQTNLSPTCFTLQKFSHTTDPATDVQNFAWKHIHSDDLVVVFDPVRDSKMKVLQGTLLLEQVDLVQKAREANEVMNMARRNGIELREEQLTISVIVRNPHLAIRYNIPESNQKRRLQLKFINETDFLQALGIVEAMGCRITQSVPSKRQQQGPGPPQSAQQSRSSEQTLVRPDTALLKPTVQSQASPAQMTPRVSSSSGVSTFAIPTSSLPTTTHDGSGFSQAGRASHVQRSYTMASPHQQAGYGDSAVPNIAPSHSVNTVADQSSAQPAGLQRFQHGAGEDATGRPSTALNRPDHSSMNQDTTMRDADPGPSTYIATMQDQRPSTTPSVAQSDILQSLPPKRELPWVKSRSSATSRPSTSSLRLPPLPAPTFATDRGSSSHTLSSGNSTLRPLTSSEGAFPSLSSSTPVRPVAPIPRTSLADITNYGSFPSLARRSSQLKEVHSATTTGAENRVPIAHSNMPASERRNSTETHVVDSGASNVNASATAAEGSHDVFAALVDQMTANDIPQLAQYAGQPVEERRAAISNWIVQHIADDSFVKLCEDVASTWQRVGLGLDRD